MGLHPTGCSCCKAGELNEIYNIKLDSELGTRRRTPINPYLLDGIEGDFETDRIDDLTGERMYLRIDMPGVGEKNINIKVENGINLFCEGEGSKEHPFDEGGRTYAFVFSLECDCCKIIDVKHKMKNGVLRVSVCRPSSRSGRNCKLNLVPVS